MDISIYFALAYLVVTAVWAEWRYFVGYQTGARHIQLDLVDTTFGEVYKKGAAHGSLVTTKYLLENGFIKEDKIREVDGQKTIDIPQ